MRTSSEGIALIIEFEGFRGNAYLDPIGIPTIGYGFTRDVRMGDVMTRAEADQRLRLELREYEDGVLRATGGNVSQSQFDALVCFAFNVGVKGMGGSSVIRAHNRGDYQAAARAFALWNKAGGKVWPGLTRRRAAEAALYLRDSVVPAQYAGPLPAVEPESRMTSSPINRAGVVAGGSATLALVSEGARTASDVKQGVQGLGDWIVPILLALVVGLCGYIVWQRVAQRRKGWS